MTVKVIIKGEVKEVRPGYFRNFLRPQKLAEPATPQKIKELELKKKAREEERIKLKMETRTEFEKMGERTIIFEAAADEKGHLYKGISAKDIAAKYKNIKAEWILLEKPIKQVGEYSVKIKAPSGDPDHFYLLHLTVKASLALH